MMQLPGDPLNEDELERLDRFLIDRLGDNDEDDDTENNDGGVLNISGLDGLFTAIVSGPVVIPPSRWLPAVWGDYEPTWESEKDFEEILTLMMRHMNGIVSALMEQPQDFEPIFLEHEVEGKTYTIVDEWCHGYMRGVDLARGDWETGGREMTILLMPLLVFATEKGWEILDKMGEDEVANIKQAIAPNVRDIHAFWLARREESAPLRSPVRHEEPRVGRNDPCPCGSGKKYKKCCLH